MRPVKSLKPPVSPVRLTGRHLPYFRRVNDAPSVAERWKRVQTMLADRFGKAPDLQATLFLIGMNEYGHPPHRSKFTKEEKQDLMHVAVCTLLEPLGYFRFEGRDADGWPHWEALKPVEATGLDAQEDLLKEAIAVYFSV